jgi:hypothetical protein
MVSELCKGVSLTKGGKIMSGDAQDQLVSFMTEMKRWEVGFCDEQDALDEDGADIVDLKESYKKNLEIILNSYSLDKGLNRDRLIDLGATIPATYDPGRDAIESDGSNAIFIVQQAAGFKSKFRFFMVKCSEVWMIDKKERLDATGSWVGSSL